MADPEDHRDPYREALERTADAAAGKEQRQGEDDEDEPDHARKADEVLTRGESECLHVYSKLQAWRLWSRCWRRELRWRMPAVRGPSPSPHTTTTFRCSRTT